ncbi:hypothetical protein B0T26DRAFT_650469, partial [Lasiosphaeria miniovina]
CDECRARKIRCDKKAPCSPCVQARRSCLATGPGKRLSGARQRVLISTQYEQKLDSFDDRLRSIEHHLEQFNSSLSKLAISPSVQSSPRGRREPTPVHHNEEQRVVFEGDSSLAAHTNFAHQFIGQAVGQMMAPPESDLGMQSALSVLRQIIQRQNKRSTSNDLCYPGQKRLPPGGFRELPMPPASFVLECLREMKDHLNADTPSVAFSMWCPYLTLDIFTDYCRQIYFSTEEYTAGIFAVVNAGLCYLLWERSLQETSGDVTTYRAMCGDNLTAVMGDINPFLQATRENMEALVLAACYALDASRPFLAWQMICLSAQACQTLGYHRLQSHHDTPGIGETAFDSRKELFNMAYTIDKALALRLGRASAFQDYDVIMPTYTESIGKDPLQRLSVLWFLHSRLQGKIYEQLFSSQALATPTGQRVQSAMALAEEAKAILLETERMGQVYGHYSNGGPSEAGVLSELDIVFKSDMVSHYATLALIYRAISPVPGPSSAFLPECVEAARSAFVCHLRCMPIYKPSLGAQLSYFHWIVLFAPFAPLVVLFCHVVQAPNSDSSGSDLELLAEFVTSLEPTCAVSEAVQHLHRLAQTLHKIASLYVTSNKPAVPPDAGTITSVGYDPAIFNNLVHPVQMPPDTQQDGYVEGMTPLAEPMLDIQFGDWFVGNMDMVGLLEEDLARFCP